MAGRVGGSGVEVWPLAVACVLGVSVAGTRADEAPPVEVPAPGMRAYADPRTGALLPGPPAGRRPEPSPAFSRSGAGLMPTRAPGGGIMIDLQGRFQSPLVATVEPDGRVRLHHGLPTE